MDEHIKVNTTRLKNDSEKVKKDIANIKKEISNMKKSVSQLDSMWDGASNTAFKTAFDNDMNAMEKIIKKLEKIYSYEVKAREKYETCEGKVAEIISEIRI